MFIKGAAMLALHDTKEIYGTFREGSRAEYAPLKWSISPAQDGQTGPNGLRLSTVQDADPVPAGKVVTGETLELVKGKPKRVLTLVDAVFTITDVDAEMSRRLEALASGYTPQERETWPTQIEEARAILAGVEPRTSLLAGRAAARGVPLADLAQVVMQKEAAFAAASGAIMGARDTLAALDPIPDPATWGGWP
jgi:hypothetical protein